MTKNREQSGRPQRQVVGPIRLLLIAAVSLITVAAFESLAVANAMPVVAAELNGVHLYALAYGITLAMQVAASPIAGSWCDSGRVVSALFLGVGGFTAGLVIAGVAPTMEILTVGRAVQGFTAAFLIVPLYTLVGTVVPGHLQPTFFAAFSFAWVVPSFVGPALAGVVVEHIGWRWVFLGVAVLVVASLAALIPALRAISLPSAQEQSASEGSDTTDALPPRRPGTIPFAALAGLAAASLQLLGAGDETELTGPVVAGIGVTAAVVLALTVPRLLPPGTVLARPRVPALLATRTTMFGIFVSTQALVPLLLQRQHEWSATMSGLALTVGSVTWAIGSWVQTQLRYEQTRNKLPMVGAGLLTIGVALTGLATFSGFWPYITLVGQTVAGLGMGLGYTAVSVLALRLSPLGRRGRTSADLQLGDSLGASIGMGITGVLLYVSASAATGLSMAFTAGVFIVALGTVAGWRSLRPSPSVTTPG